MQIIYEIILLLSGLGIFLYGIHNISVGMESVASQSLRKSLHNIAKNPLKSYGAGLGATLLVENSSVTTVLVVGLLNAGLISLYHALSMILGCNLGSTLILILFCFDTFKFVDILCLAVLVGAIFMLFAKSSKMQRVGKTIAGFGMLFCGLKLMSISMENIMSIPGANEFIASITNIGLLFFIGIFFGATFHVLGTTALMISLISLSSSPITLISAITVILGANIGSTISAILASLKSNVHSKRAALFNTCVNTICSVIMLMIALFTPWLQWLESVFVAPSFVLVATLIILNILIGLIFMPLLKPIELLLTKMIKDRQTKGQKQALVFQIAENDFRNIVVVKHQILQGVLIILHSILDIYKKIHKNIDLSSSEKVNFKYIEKNIKITNQYVDDTINNILRVNIDVDNVDYNRFSSYNSAMLEAQILLQSADNLVQIMEKQNLKQKSLLKSEIKAIDDILEIVAKLFDGILNLYKTELDGELIDTAQGDILLDIEDEFSHQKTKAKKVLLQSLSKQSDKSNYDVLFNIFSELDQTCDHLANLLIKTI